MRCYICDVVIDEPKSNPETGKDDPCDKCMEVIEATLAGFLDTPSTEDLPGDDAILEELYPRVYDPFDTED